jgi:hypothetical protein
MGLSRPPNTGTLFRSGPKVPEPCQGPMVPGFLDRVPPKYEGQFHYAPSAELRTFPTSTWPRPPPV